MPTPEQVFAKPFAWSYSQLKNFKSCPKRHYHVDKIRDVFDPPGDAVLWGNELHDALAKAIGTDDNEFRAPRERIIEAPLPDTMATYQPWVTRFRKARESGAQVNAEMSLAITRDFKKCSWFDPAAWFRTKVDVSTFVNEGQFGYAGDWKTGRRLADSPQLVLTGIAMFAHYPALEAIRTEFIWLKEWNGLGDRESMDRVSDRISFRRADMPSMWNGVAQDAAILERAFMARDYPAKPTGLCRSYCPVISCEHNGKR